MDVIAGYRIEERLGSGGSGSVYRGVNPQGQTVALKVLNGGRPLSEVAERRFRREADAHLRMDHPHVVTIREATVDRGRAVLVMDLVEGVGLDALLERRGVLPLRQAARIGYKLALALDYVHRRGVIHRDLKPANVLLDPDGEPMLTDFGLAKQVELEQSRLTQSGSFLGTPGYWPPEQAAGALDRMGPRSDVYGLGAILYAVLTGRPPHAGSLPASLATAQEPVRRPSEYRAELDPRLEAIVLRCLEVEPDARWPDMRSLGRALEDYLATSAPRPPRARPTWLLALALLVGGGLGATAIVVVGTRAAPPSAPSPPPPEPARHEVAPTEPSGPAEAPDPTWLAPLTEAVSLEARARHEEARARYAVAAQALEQDARWAEVPRELRPGLVTYMLDHHVPDLWGQGVRDRIQPLLDAVYALDPKGFTLNMVRVQRKAGGNQRAKVFCERYLREHGDDYDVLSEHAQAALALEEREVAQEDLRRMHALRPSPALLVARAELLLMLERPDEALTLTEQAEPESLQDPKLRDQVRSLLRRLRPDDLVAALLLQAEVEKQQGRPAEAKALLDRALELAPDDPEILFQRALVGEYDDLRRVVALRPDDLAARGLLANHLMRTQELDAALSHARIVLDAGDRVVPKVRGMALLVRGYIHGKRGLIDEALDDLSASIELVPDVPEAYLRRAPLLAIRGDLPGAARDCTRAIDLGGLTPTDQGNSHALRAIAREEAGDLRGAAEDCRAAVGLLRPGEPLHTGSQRSLERLREHLPAD